MAACRRESNRSGTGRYTYGGAHRVDKFARRAQNRAMIEDTLSKLEVRIRALSAMPAEKRTELAALIGTLREEIQRIPGTHADQAESIARFAELSTHEAMRPSVNAELRRLSLDGLTVSARGFEASHPKLVDVVNSICASLSSLGI